MLNKRFLEINGALPKNPVAPPPPPKPVRLAVNTTLSNRFLEINGVQPVLNAAATSIGNAEAPSPAPVPTPPRPQPASSFFLNINDAERRATPQAQAVDDAVQNLDTAIAQRDAMPLMIQHYYQGDVTEARSDLETAVRTEVDETPLQIPYYITPLDAQRINATQIADRYSDDPISEEVNRAVENVVVDIEVDNTLAQMDRASSSERAYDRLTIQFGDISERAQARLVQEEQVELVLDDVAAAAVEPLADIADADFVRPLVDDALLATLDLTEQADHPDLATEIITRVQPALDQAVIDNKNRTNGFLGSDSLFDYGSRIILGQISDTMVRTEMDLPNEPILSQASEAAMADLARTVVDGTEVFDQSSILVPVNQYGTGVALDVAVIKQVESDPDVEASFLVERVIENYESYIEHTVQGAVDDYADHTEELNFYAGNFPGSAEQLNDAINEYVERQGADWEADRQDLFREVELHGEQIFLQEQLIDDVLDILPDGEDKLAEAASQDATATALDFFANGQVSASTSVDLNDALQFASGLSLGRKATSVVRKLANASLQNGLRAVLIDFDPRNVSSLRSTADRIRELATAELAAALDVSPEEMSDMMNELADLMEAGEDAGDLRVKIQAWEADLDNLDKFPPDSAVGRTLRGAGAIFAAVATAGSWNDVATDQTAETIISTAVDTLATGQSSAEFYASIRGLDESHWANRFAGYGPLSKLLGITGLGLSTPGIYNDFASGNYAGGTLDSISLGSAALSLLHPKGKIPFTAGRFFGPWGAGASILAGIGSLGWDQVQRVRASNQYTGDAARDFLNHAKLDSDARYALVDRSGEGYSVVPILMNYADQHGLTPEQSIEWLNSLDKDQLDVVRDMFHLTIDDLDGNPDDFFSYSTADNERFEKHERLLNANPGLADVPDFFFAPENRNQADWLLDFLEIARPDTFAES